MPEPKLTSRSVLQSVAGLLILLGGAGMLAPVIADAPAEFFMCGALAAAAGLVLAIASFSTVLAAVAVFLGFVGMAAGLFPVPSISSNLMPARRPPPDPGEVDDPPGSRHPAAVPVLVAACRIDHRNCAVNRSEAVIKLDVADASSAEQALAGELFPTLGAAASAAKDAGLTVLPSVDMVDAVGKKFDDEQVAAFELALHSGDAVLPGGKQGFLARLLAEVAASDHPGRGGAAAVLETALVLGGSTPATAADQLARAQARAAEWSLTPSARPIGIYSKSEALAAIFRRDRFLQLRWSLRHPSEVAIAACLAAALDRKPALGAEYALIRRLAQALTNPDAAPGLELALAHRDRLADPAGLAAAVSGDPAWTRLDARGSGERGLAFWPFATSPESQLFARIYRDGDPPGDTMAALVAGIRTGKVSLQPVADSGWYDHQLYALETLLLTDRAQEADKLELTARYKKRLRQAFEAMMTKRRETQVKNLWMGMLGSAVRPPKMHPELTVEPTATCYLRTARAYRFLEHALAAALGEARLGQVASGTPGTPLPAALRAIARRFFGLYLVACEDLGMVPQLSAGEVPPASGPPDPATEPPPAIALPDLPDREDRARLWRETRAWLAQLHTDPGVCQDQRVIVPVLALSDGRLRCWAVLGARLSKLKAEYVRAPRVASIGTLTTDIGQLQQALDRPEQVILEPAEYAIPVNVFRELTVGSTPLTREELRTACDRAHTVDDALEALGVAVPKRVRWSYALGAALVAMVAAAVWVRRRS